MRDDFSQQTLDVLGKRVGVRCSNPACRKLTTGPRIDVPRIVNIGVGAHITAASLGGPRFDASLSSDQRRSADNGIWLCQNCAKLVDNDAARYSAELLRRWKQRAEAAALAEVEGASAGAEPRENGAELALSYEKVRIHADRHDYKLLVTLRNLGSEPLGEYHIDLEMPAPIIERARDIYPYVAERSNERIAFFRVTTRNVGSEIYPGDARVALGIPYYMDHKIYFDRRGLFEQIVRATLYRRGFPPLAVERPFEEFQVF